MYYRMVIISKILFIGLITLISGYSDSLGFIHASRMWTGGKLSPRELLLSATFFAGGIISYWFIVKLLQEFGIMSASVQTILWFTATIIGVAVMSGDFLKWSFINQSIAIFVFIGVVWFLYANEAS